jgi:hypothetical protein
MPGFRVGACSHQARHPAGQPRLRQPAGPPPHLDRRPHRGGGPRRQSGRSTRRSARAGRCDAGLRLRAGGRRPGRPGRAAQLGPALGVDLLIEALRVEREEQPVPVTAVRSRFERWIKVEGRGTRPWSACRGGPAATSCSPPPRLPESSLTLATPSLGGGVDKMGNSVGPRRRGPGPVTAPNGEIAYIVRKNLARPEGLEPPTPRFVVWCSIQLSYGRNRGRRCNPDRG